MVTIFVLLLKYKSLICVTDKIQDSDDISMITDSNTEQIVRQYLR